ncbi:iron-sulfur cluster transfer protein NUBPL isoform X2 [Plodia interpunctella]|uniref:iron-sulfur cluster transfer protein NUBPL isoform X2 n=1 Tax=Plodia interpunctella TaxID=58824 RepID=UPI002368D031|nr:iron-sulfur protein NUBPL isoform X2 [Plodia interpunctella]
MLVNSMLQRLNRQIVISFSPSTQSVRLKNTKSDINEHRAKIMGRGLPEKKPLPGVKNIILVASGKGGVGKTTTAVNLACAMKVIEPDKEIGLLDADVFGPSVPLMMNISGEPMLNDDNLIEPILNYGVKCMSMGLLVSGENAVVWRGLMVMQALERLTRHVAWGPLHCLLVDTPPGTGDTHLSLAQNLPIDGAIVVTTPQSAALQVTKRGVNMFEKLKVPIIGMVENMSHAVCTNCGTVNHIFGSDTKQSAQDMGLEIIESFEVDQNMSDCINSGKPAIYALPDSIHAEKYRQLANKVYRYIDDKGKERVKASE